MVASQQVTVQETVKIFLSRQWRGYIFIRHINIIWKECYDCYAHYQLMYNQGTQFVLDLYRKYFGFIATRERVKGRKDAFFELHANEESQSDQQTLRRLGKTVGKVSEQCFGECVSLQYNLFTLEEAACVRTCVENYFGGYQHIVKYTHSQMNP